MNVQLFYGGKLTYDNALPEEKNYNLHSLLINESVNKGGTTTFVMPRSHVMRDKIIPYKAPVEVYKDGQLRWRGRPIPPVNEDFYGTRTVLCEGELCFLQDAIHRPYAYSDTAANVFAAVIGVYNAAVEPWKRFLVGTITVAGNVEMTAKSPETTFAAIQKLLSDRGGYIFFDSANDGSRRINWYADFPYTCTQTIRYGYNLTDCSSRTDGTGFATRIIPYGATVEGGNRITINNNGKDYVENEAAVALYGVVEKSVIYNDISDPTELLKRAQKDVLVSGSVPAVITLGALDMSRQDLTIDAFAVGQKVPAESEGHSLTGMYYLTSLKEDLVVPQAGGITLTRDIADTGAVQKTLSGSVASKDKATIIAKETVNEQTRQEIFNKLTDNGTIQGIFQEDGHWVINASIAKIVELITDHLISESGNDMLEICASEITMTSKHGKTLSMKNWEDGVFYLYMTQHNQDGAEVGAGQIGAMRLQLGGSWSNPTFGIWTDENANTNIKVDGAIRAVRWKDNGDGTFTLIGT